MASDKSGLSLGPAQSEHSLASLWRDALSDFDKTASEKLKRSIFQPQYSSIEDVLDDLQEKKEMFGLNRKSGGKLSRVRSAVSDHFPVIERAVSFVGFGVEVASQVTPLAAPGAVIVTGLGWVAKACKDMHDDFDKIADFYGETAKLFRRVQMLEGKLGPHCNYRNLLEDITNVFGRVMQICAIAIEQPQKRFKTFLKKHAGGEDELGDAFNGLSSAIDALQDSIIVSTAANVVEVKQDVKKLRSEGKKAQKEVSAQISDGFEETKEAQRLMLESQERSHTEVSNQISDGFGDSKANQRIIIQNQKKSERDMKIILERLESQKNDQSKPGHPPRKKGSKDPAARKDTALAEIREAFRPCDQSAYIHELSDWAVRVNYSFLEEYHSWVTGKSDKKVLIVTGAPGIGKTYLSLSALGRLRHQAEITASFFFREGYPDFEDLKPALRSIINQLAEQDSEWSRNIRTELRKSKDEILLLSPEQLWSDIIEKAASGCNQQRNSQRRQAYLIFDGIDEAGGSTHTKLIDILARTSSELPIRVLITTRELESASQDAASMTVEAMKIDNMRPYFHHLCKRRIQKLPRLRRFPRYMKDEIVSKLSKQADCMLYVENMLLRLEAIGLKHLVKRDLSEQHRPLPKSLDALYAMMMDEIQKGRTSKQCDVLRTLFVWLAFSNRHLKLREATEITKLSAESSSTLIIEDELVGKLSGILELVRVPEAHVDDDDEDSTTVEEGLSPERAVNISSTPQSLNEEDDSALPIQFQERCLRDFFKRGGTAEGNMQTSARMAHLNIFTSCVRILEDTAKSSIEDNSLLDYAANYWSKHFIQFNQIARDENEPSPSTEEKKSVVEALATIHSADVNISKTLERNSWKMYSEETITQGQQWPELVGWWANEADEIEGLSDKSTRWIQSVNGEGNGRMMLALAHAHASNWTESWDMFLACEAFKFARDALCLTDLVSGEEREALSSEKAESVSRIANLLISAEDNGSTSSAIAIIQESFECNSEAYKNYEKALEQGMSQVSYNRFKLLARLTRVSPDSKKAAENAAAALVAANSIPEENDNTSDLRNESRVEAFVLMAVTAHSQGNGDDVIHYLHEIQKSQTQDSIAGYLLDCLTIAVKEKKGNSGLFCEIEEWSGPNRFAWLDWAFKTKIEDSLKRFEDAAMAEKRADFIISTYQDILNSYGDSTTSVWAQFWKAKTHHSLGGTELKAAKGILKNLLDVGNIHRSKQILYDARVHLSKILYEEFRSMDNPLAKRALLEEMKNIPQIDRQADRDGLSNSLTSIPRARMMRVLDVSSFEKALTDTFNVCISALRDDDPENDFRSLRLLTQVLTFLPGLQGHARIAISLQLSDLRLLSPEENIESAEMATDDAWFADSNLEEYLRSQLTDFPLIPAEEDLSGWAIFCDGCGLLWESWSQDMYSCLICTDVDLCESCFKAIRYSESGKIGDGWRVVCGKDHKYIRAPLKGWGGVQNGIMKIGQRRLSCKAWLDRLENEEWPKAWKTFWRSESFVSDIM